MTVNIATLQADLEPLAAALAEIQADIANLTREADDLKAQIRALVENAGPGTYGAGDHAVIVSLNRRFNEKRALSALPEALAPIVTYTETHVDKKKLEALAADLYEAAFDVYEPRVAVKEA